MSNLQVQQKLLLICFYISVYLLLLLIWQPFNGNSLCLTFEVYQDRGKDYMTVLSIQLFGVFAPSENCNCLNQVKHHPHSRRKAFQMCKQGKKSDINIQLDNSHSLFGWSSQMIWYKVEQWLLKKHLNASSFARGIEVQMYWTANMARQCHRLQPETDATLMN